MNKLLVISKEVKKTKALEQQLHRYGFACKTSDNIEAMGRNNNGSSLDLAIIYADGSMPPATMESLWERLRTTRSSKQLPVIVLVSKNMIDEMLAHPEIDDFIVEPADFTEIITRIKRILLRKQREAGNKEIIKCGDMEIDLAKCEVSLSGRLLTLTYMEYELLKFLAINKGRVFSRDALLNEVWGYDYYGGDRTVDVHIRRLRSKIEDPTHTFVDTVRNIGYKFRDSK